jgi:hypothetical protein
MADTPTGAPAQAPDAAAPLSSAQAVGYSLVSSYSTVQVLSPTDILNVVQVTIQTRPSGVIASIPVQESVFNKGEAGTELSNFANAIEQIMTNPHVIAATGSSKREDTGLLTYTVMFTVEYTDPVAAPLGATATAEVNVGQLDFSDALIGRTLLAGVTATIDGVYGNLKAAASG